jgi:hypothetical protein
MKKLILIICLIFALPFGCKQEIEPHWSYKDCLIDISKQIHSTVFDYTVKEIEHDETAKGDDEIHCFDITITKSAGYMLGESKRYCCFAVVSDGEVMYVDCDLWEE